jgi:MFS family permease
MLWTINGAQILLSQPLKSWIIRRYAFSLEAQIVSGTVFLAVGLLCVGFSTSYWQFIVAMIVITCGEILVFPSVPVWMVDKADYTAKGKVLGYIAASSTIGRMLGPYVGGVFYENMPGHWLFTVMSIVCALSVFCYIFANKLATVKHVRVRVTRPRERVTKGS